MGADKRRFGVVPLGERLRDSAVELLATRTREPRVCGFTQQTVAVAVAVRRLLQHRGLEAVVQSVQDLALRQGQYLAQQAIVDVVADDRRRLEHLACGSAQPLQSSVEQIVNGHRY